MICYSIAIITDFAMRSRMSAGTWVSSLFWQTVNLPIRSVPVLREIMLESAIIVARALKIWKRDLMLWVELTTICNLKYRSPCPWRVEDGLSELKHKYLIWRDVCLKYQVNKSKSLLWAESESISKKCERKYQLWSPLSTPLSQYKMMPSCKPPQRISYRFRAL